MNFAEGTWEGLHPTEIKIFEEVLRGLGGIGLEIGCCDGYSTCHILALSDLHLTSIDPFVTDSMAPLLIGSPERFAKNIAPWGERHTLIKNFSQHVRWELPIDFLFIDGDHRYEAVLHDFDQFTPHLRRGGIVAMHDSRMGRPGGAPFHPGPTQVANERLYTKPWEIIGEAFSLTVARKSVL